MPLMSNVMYPRSNHFLIGVSTVLAGLFFGWLPDNLSLLSSGSLSAILRQLDSVGLIPTSSIGQLAVAGLIYRLPGFALLGVIGGVPLRVLRLKWLFVLAIAIWPLWRLVRVLLFVALAELSGRRYGTSLFRANPWPELAVLLALYATMVVGLFSVYRAGNFRNDRNMTLDSHALHGSA